MLISETVDVERAEERWRRVIGIFLRLNGRSYSETMNMSLTLNMNLAIFLVKYLKIKPIVAEKMVYYEIYALFKGAYKGIVKDTNYEVISEGDVLDLVKLRVKEKVDVERDLEINPQTYVHNHHGGFRVEFVNRYIKEVLERPKRIDGKLLKDEFAKKDTEISIKNMSDQGGGETFNSALVGYQSAQNLQGLGSRMMSMSMNSQYMGGQPGKSKIHAWENSWSIISEQMESYQNQTLIDQSDGGVGGTMNTQWDIKQLIQNYQEFRNLDTFFRFVRKIQDKSQFELRINEFKGPRATQNCFEIFCPYKPNCKFAIVYKYYLEFAGGPKMEMREKILFERMGQLVHIHQEKMDIYKLSKKYLRIPKGEQVP